MPDIRTLGLEQCVCAALLRQTLNQIPEKRAYKAHAACGHSGNPEPYAAAIDNQGPDTSGIGRLAKSCAENRTPMRSLRTDGIPFRAATATHLAAPVILDVF